ncbi:hypothetical protein [Nitrosomonas sp.]|uniref:hypothetical protein n=1 Tax=Nitrosomonas sp. TaxID=42353 RepID=UPI001DF97B4B|nr:hypothetical protein [Nitrosomonas sp.]MCB1948301.1 hypothetical protein [Nitrosomonas sp.]
MESHFKLLETIDISPEFKPALESVLVPWRFKNNVDILVVVDTGIGYTPGSNFGVGTVIEHVRKTKVGCMRFRIDIALRNGLPPTIVPSPAEFEPKYLGFRFDMENDGQSVLDQYEQIWCFGLHPNTTSTDDNVIDNPANFPTQDSELAALTQWMNRRKGGLFGTGDHHILGASMCHRIPRLGSMRRWTNADGVPPVGSPNRIDTLRPPTPAYEPDAPGGPLPLGNGVHQGDLKVQPIQWIPWQTRYWPIFYQKRPHPVLCHPTLGPIDVMPDHAHEGLCRPVTEIDLNATYDFDGTGNKPEYPPAIGGGAKPEPFIIANGSTLGDPPYNFVKGAQPARPSFPMVSVYDGHRAGVGRVATDSTWHHWMGLNITQIKNADNDDWKKISRYFVNLALWLNPPGYSTKCLYVSALTSHFEHVGLQEFIGNRSAHSLGKELRHHLHSIFGPCWVTQIIFDLVWEIKPKPWEIIQEIKNPLLLRGIDAVMIEEMLLGEIVLQTMDTARQVKDAAVFGKLDVKSKLSDPDKLLTEAVDKSFKSLSNDLVRHFDGMMRVAKAMQT